MSTTTLSSHLILHLTQTKNDIVIDAYHNTCIDWILSHEQELLTHRGDTQQLLDQVLDIPDRHRAQHSALNRCPGRSVNFVLCDKCDAYLNDDIKMLENPSASLSYAFVVYEKVSRYDESVVSY